MSILKVENVSVRFGGLTAVNEVSFEVKAGQIFSIIGPNGAGKTTLFNAITGVYVPSSGSIRFEDKRLLRPFGLKVLLGLLCVAILSAAGLLFALNVEELWEESIVAHYEYLEPFHWSLAVGSVKEVLFRHASGAGKSILFVGFGLGLLGAFLVWRRTRLVPEFVASKGVCRTFQNIRLFPGMSVLENVLVGYERKLSYGMFSAIFHLPAYSREEQHARERALEILKLLGLEDKAHLPATSLPYGHQRRLEIARALVSSPKILLLDEPAAGMNPVEAAELIQMIQNIRDIGVTILLIEHHMRVVMSISDRIAVLDYGNKIAEGAPEEIRQNPKVIAAYLGEDVPYSSSEASS